MSEARRDSAYKLLWYKQCNWCSLSATHKVYNHVQQCMGHYCEQHADQKVAEVNHREKVMAEYVKQS